MSANPYAVLGVSVGATEEEIKKRYRALVKQYHPDLHPGDEEAARKMSEINEAYEQIRSGNASSAAYYSQSEGAHASGSFNRGGSTYYYSYADPEEVFRTFFGGAAHSDMHFSEGLYSRIEECIRSGDHLTAARLLNSVQIRAARWYYLAALLYYKTDRPIKAREFAAAAVRLEPYNNDYRSLYEELREAEEEYPPDMAAGRIRRFISAVTAVLAVLFLLHIFHPLLHLMLI